MITHNLGYPRIGDQRELKRAVEKYWKGKIGYNDLTQVATDIKAKNWSLQKELGLDLVPSNDFSYYDQMLDMAFTVGAIPERFDNLPRNSDQAKLDLYFAMARGYQDETHDVTAMEMTKWFDTNYHYIVPEFQKDQSFSLSYFKFLDDFISAKEKGIVTKPAFIGPVSFLLLGKEKEPGFDRIDLLENILPVYIDLITMLQPYGVEWIQFDEPYLVADLTEKEKKALQIAYKKIKDQFPNLKLLLTTYFGGLNDNLPVVSSLPVDADHLELVRDPDQLEPALEGLSEIPYLSLGVVDGRNIWMNDYEKSLKTIKRVTEQFDEKNIMLAPSCSLLHVPCDLDLETEPNDILNEIKCWLAFAKQKVNEVVDLKELSIGSNENDLRRRYEENQKAIEDRKNADLIHNPYVQERLTSTGKIRDLKRTNFDQRKTAQQQKLGLPLYPTTTIGSFPQTGEIRKLRAQYRKDEISKSEYDQQIKSEIESVIRWQEQLGLDVLVHGEFERNDMVEYFGDMLKGFAFTQNGWVQSYGSRCVKPPIIFGDVYRPQPMTVVWHAYAQSLTDKPVKGMLTGPVTIMKWSFVRDDQPLRDTCLQIALAIKDEVQDLEKANIGVIQIDEPALREALPLKKTEWPDFLEWAVGCFRLTYNGVKDETQIHTHMCYAEFNDIINDIIAMDADVITIECSRSQMELLEAFGKYKYPNDIGPGVYDIHSARIPSKNEMIALIEKAGKVIPKEHIWINPDCGLKTRSWNETEQALVEMITSAKTIRESAVNERV